MRNYLDGDCTRQQFINQYNPIKLEVGKTYRQESDSWAKKHYKILYTDNQIAVGIVVYCGIYQSSIKGCGGYEMFYVDNGFKYQDICRPCYRLLSEVK